MIRPDSHVPASLDPSPDQIVKMGNAALQVIADYFGALPGLPIFPHVSGGSIRAQMSAEAPVEGQDFATLLDFFAQVILPSSRHNGHPRFFGYVASPGTAATAIADLLASALNSNLTSWRSGPGPTELERQTIQWIKQIIGYPAEADGLFVSGGSMANFSALAAARDAKSPINLSTHGCQALDQPLRLYMSQEGHHSLSKAAGLLGIGRDHVRLVNVNERFQMDTSDLITAD